MGVVVRVARSFLVLPSRVWERDYPGVRPKRNLETMRIWPRPPLSTQVIHVPEVAFLLGATCAVF